jgi:fascin 1/2
VPWGDDALITLVFFDEHSEGRYGLMASNGKYLTASGRLTDAAGADAQFLLGFHDDQISLRDAGGSYLSCVGGNGLLKVNKQRITKDELFVIQDSEPQFTIKSNSQNKQVSVRSGLEVKANQADVTDEERFQMEVGADGTVHFMTNKLKYWALQDDSSIAAVETKKGAKTGFNVVYQDNRVRFVCAGNGKHVKVKPNGSLMANGDGSEQEGIFTMTIINRPELVLRGQYGFMGIKPESRRITCNSARGEIFTLTPVDGAYTLALGGQSWAAEPDGVTAKSAVGKLFILEFVESSKCLIKDTESGRYLEGEQNGGVKATGQGKSINTLWEF